MPKVIRDANGKPFSKWKPAAKYEYMLTDEMREHCRKEYRFTTDRDWRFDFAWPEQKVAVEVDGFGFGHQAQQRLAHNHEKQNAAVLMGWRVLRYTSRCLGSKAGVAAAVDQTWEVLCDV